jgi:oxaloacetate decarboxylase alpha subunit/pyruvate carboxylase subunit B
MSDQVKMTAMNYAIDRPAAENPVKVMDLTFRDGHQSLFATPGRTEDMIPVAEMMDEVGFWALETWGGAPLTPCTASSTRIRGSVSAL